LLEGSARHADRADNLAFHQDWDLALERKVAAQFQQPEVEATFFPDILEQLSGTPVEDPECLVLGYFDAAELRAIHALKHDEVGARIEDGDDYGYFIAFGLRQSVIATNRLLATSALKNFTISAGSWLLDVYVIGGSTPPVL